MHVLNSLAVWSPPKFCRCRAAAAGASGGGTAQQGQLALLGKMLRWPAPQLFPALDVARLLALDAAFAPVLAQEAGSAVAPGERMWCSDVLAGAPVKIACM